MSGILDHLSIGFGVAFSWTNILVAAIGSFFGTMVGVLPGLGPINGVAMLIPIAFATVSYTHLTLPTKRIV